MFIAAVISLYALSLPSCSNPADRTVRDKLALVDTLLLSDPGAALDTLATHPPTIPPHPPSTSNTLNYTTPFFHSVTKCIYLTHPPLHPMPSSLSLPPLPLTLSR